MQIEQFKAVTRAKSDAVTPYVIIGTRDRTTKGGWSRFLSFANQIHCTSMKCCSAVAHNLWAYMQLVVLSACIPCFPFLTSHWAPVFVFKRSLFIYLTEQTPHTIKGWLKKAVKMLKCNQAHLWAHQHTYALVLMCIICVWRAGEGQRKEGSTIGEDCQAAVSHPQSGRSGL